MFRGNKKYIYIFCGLFALIVAAQYLLPRPTDWSRNYLGKNRSPFGCYAIYNLLEGTWSRTVEYNNQTLYLLNEKQQRNTSLLIVNGESNMNGHDVENLYKFLKQGNTVLIAANSFSGPLADSLHLQTTPDFFYGPVDSLLNKKGEQVKLSARNIREKYNYPQLTTFSYFSNFDTTRFKVLACYQNYRACFIRANVNGGKLYLMSIPDAFGNYFIANHPNRSLAYTALSYIKNEHLIWDEYYKTYNITNYSILKFILDSDALYAAYLLLIFSLILYMIFEGRRRQRAIPVVAPPANSTLEFVNVISHVYYNSKNHHSIAAERIRYFYETIRRRFHVDTTKVKEGAFIDEVATLSGIERKKVQQLFVYTERLLSFKELTDHELVELNRQIHNFNKNSLR